MDQRDRRDEKKEAPEFAEQSRFLRWLDNVWYHYKWHIIIGIFAIVTLIVCLSQCSSRESYDLVITYAGGKTLNGTEQEGLSAALEVALPEDFDGNGTKAVQLVTYGIYTEEELTAMYSYENSEGNRVLDNLNYSNAKKQSIDEGNAFSTFIKTGECAVWFVSPYVYELYHMETIAAPLSEIFGSDLPEGAVNDYAVRLGDTAFYRSYAAVRELPADTYIVLTRQLVYGKVAKDAFYENCRDTYVAIVKFRAE
ncbi:MAG: hypothetical protein J5885_03275 [Clostridia bacterium]|nr:hypothetical protein [Clostridia bacterium]